MFEFLRRKLERKLEEAYQKGIMDGKMIDNAYNKGFRDGIDFAEKVIVTLKKENKEIKEIIIEREVVKEKEIPFVPQQVDISYPNWVYEWKTTSSTNDHIVYRPNSTTKVYKCNTPSDYSIQYTVE